MQINRLAISSSHLNVMLKAAFNAATGLIRDFGELEHLQVSRKGTGGFVTKADQRSEKIIFQTLSRARPTYGFLMEEGGEVKGEDPSYRWIIDPLDATSNFMHGFPHFAISIALEYNNEIVSALVYDPITDELFYAEKGRGCFANETRLRVAARHDLSESLISIGFPHQKNNCDTKFYESLANINKQVSAIRKTGSTVLDICYVAAGRLDSYIGFDMTPWDTASGILMVKEAGGFVYNFTGDPLKVTHTNMIAGNEKITHQMMKLL